MDIFNIIIIIGLFHFSLSDGNIWRDYPTCRIGRLQSPIRIKEYESIYANNFSFVYQNYKECNCNNSNNTNNTNNYAYTIECNEGTGGYVNFERGGVIKQYEFIRAEIYPALHEVDGQRDKKDYELHLIHKKNLDFVTNKNQYRSIQDPNMYLIVVLRYRECSGEDPCSSDNGLLEQLTNDNFTSINLNEYNIFQDKRAYFYEGSFVHIPCDENVNYYIVKDFFNFNISNQNFSNSVNDGIKFDDINLANVFGRPIFKNFMNYREVLGNYYFSFKNIIVSFLFIIIFL